MIMGDKTADVESTSILSSIGNFIKEHIWEILIIGGILVLGMLRNVA